ncbi:MAG: hypothetical protein U9N77_02575 [Thermodesulfobacteriota bacterium]|nr:hypothetical protein [Thermodesulfobacteriota bacterium]
MNRQISTREVFKIWAEHLPTPEDHIPEKRLYLFSLKKGLQQADNDEINHLSQCPQCLDVWKTLCDLNRSTHADDYDEKGGGSILSFGILQAASGEITGPVYMKSDCEKFMLGILPEEGSLKKAMIVLETVGDDKIYQGMKALIKDARGITILQAKIKHGRAAVKTDTLDTIDLSTWSVVLSKSSDENSNG